MRQRSHVAGYFRKRTFFIRLGLAFTRKRRKRWI